MKITCKTCGKEFDAEPMPQTKCGTSVTSANSRMVSTIETICPECKSKELKK